MADVFKFEFNGRSPVDFEAHFVEVESKGQWVEIRIQGESPIKIEGFLLAQISWRFLDQYFKSRVIMSGLKSFWDVITIAENHQRIKLYQMTEKGFRQLWGKYIKEGIL